MTRPIKFRAWDEEAKKMLEPFSVSHLINNYNSEYANSRDDISDFNFETMKEQKPILMQFTGLLDKNGKEIYEGDIVGVRYLCGEKSQYYTHGAHTVVLRPLYGLELNFAKLLGDEKDQNNQYPVHSTLCVRYGTLDVDTQDQKYDCLAVQESWGENHMHHSRWKQNDYSNDIEVIGNIYENPDLLNA